jgi:endonuclease VIII
MSEGPEIHRLAAKLNQELSGSPVLELRTTLPKPAAWLKANPGAVEGRRILRVYAAGKNLLFSLEEELFFLFHLLLFGSLRSHPVSAREELDPEARAWITTPERRLVFSKSQVFQIGRGDPFRQVYNLEVLGPDICEIPFDAERFLSRLGHPSQLSRELGPALLEQSVAAGLGNYLKSDILFECRLSPWQRVYQLSEEERRRLAGAIPRVAQRALKNRGQTIPDELMARLPAEARPYQGGWWDRHWVFRRTGRPCWSCGTPIAWQRQGPGEGRATYYCPRCQVSTQNNLTFPFP